MISNEEMEKIVVSVQERGSREETVDAGLLLYPQCALQCL